MSKKMGNERGLTLVELRLILSIMAILVGMITPSLTGVTGGARAQAAAEELGIVQWAFDTLMVEAGAITVAENLASGGVSVGPSTVITCYKDDGTAIHVPAGAHY